MNIIFNVKGGLGKSIISTAVLKAIKKEYKEAYVIVLTSYPDVFIDNPNVNKVIHHNDASDLHKDYIEDKEVKVFVSEPYLESDYITESKSLIEIWCNLCGVPFNNEEPEIFISKSEMEYFAPFYKTDKPIMVIQPNGGAKNQPLKYNWVRDIPAVTMKKIIDKYKDKYTIVHVKREDQPSFKNTVAALDTFRSVAILLILSEKRLIIDSFVQHMAAALGLPSVVCWVGTSPKVFGYEGHINIKANKENKKLNIKTKGFQKYSLFEDISRCPYKESGDIFDLNKITKAIDRQKKI